LSRGSGNPTFPDPLLREPIKTPMTKPGTSSAPDNNTQQHTPTTLNVSRDASTEVLRTAQLLNYMPYEVYQFFEDEYE